MITKPSDWTNVPLLVAEFALHLNNQVKALTGYLRDQSDLETIEEAKEHLLELRE